MTTKADRAAMQLALDRTRADPERTEQIDSMLASRPWEDVASFAVYHCQCETLHLKPWQPPPCWIDDPQAELARPQHEYDGRHEAARLLKQMLAVGVSKYHPDPLAAIEEAKRRKAKA